MVTLVKADIDNLEAVEADFNRNIINDLSVSNVLSNPQKYNYQQTFNFKGFFEFVLSAMRSLCLYPTEYCLIDGVKPKLDTEFYFPIDLNNIMMALDRKLMGDTPITHAELYTWNIRSELKQPMFYILNVYFLEAEIINFANKKNIEIQAIAEIEKTEAIKRKKEVEKAKTASIRIKSKGGYDPNDHNSHIDIDEDNIADTDGLSFQKSLNNETTQARTFLDAAIEHLRVANKSDYYRIFQEILLLLKNKEPDHDSVITPKQFMSHLVELHRDSSLIHAVTDEYVTFNKTIEINGKKTRDTTHKVKIERIKGNFSKFKNKVINPVKN